MQIVARCLEKNTHAHAGANRLQAPSRIQHRMGHVTSIFQHVDMSASLQSDQRASGEAHAMNMQVVKDWMKLYWYFLLGWVSYLVGGRASSV